MSEMVLPLLLSTTGRSFNVRFEAELCCKCKLFPFENKVPSESRTSG